MTQKTDTKQKIIQTAVDLIWMSGYGAVSVDDICKTAGVQKGSFYHYFASKAALALEAFEAHAAEIHEHMDHLFSASMPPLERIKKMAEFCYEYQHQTLQKYGHVCGCPFATFGSEMVGQDDTMRQMIEDLFSKHERYYQNLFNDLIADGLMPRTTDVKAKAIDLDSYIMGKFYRV